MLRFVFVLALLSLSGLANADKCPLSEDGSQRLSPHKIKYKLIEYEPGRTFTVSGRKYVMMRVPFTEFGSDKRYAVNYPARMYSGASYTAFGIRHIKAEACSDVAIQGLINPSHKLGFQEASTTQQLLGSSEEGSLDVLRSTFVSLVSQIGETRLSLNISTEEYETGKIPLPPGDADSTDNLDWSALNHDPFTLQKILQTLVSRVYISEE
jgi:hypothetical protein